MRKRKRPGFRAVSIVRRIISSDLENMEHFKMFLVSAIREEEKSIEQRFERATKDMRQEEIEHYGDWYLDDYYMVKNVFSRISLQSYVMILYSYIEAGMNRLCNSMRQDKAREQKERKEKELELRYDDLQGKGIKRAKLYLEKVIGLDLDVGEKGKNKKYWNELLALNKIRNAIVHDDGWATDNILKDVTIKQHTKKGRLEIESRGKESYGRIVIKAEYLDWIISQAREFFRRIVI